ncbi:RNA polymerase I, subunit RPA34.5 [Beauveria brongniartii RCEF 3172]|uniref:RNA polymerase I, subunit RPA34.5 n=1 Tax=Beauveria brongniartii RCEF 3172 TaxID=1081107 RepID=A0A167FWM2_9HYPO|nr:RNA polymerase I, subunit RPA34.5 [Beauveria brongniartii RCEF 3172]
MAPKEPFKVHSLSKHIEEAKKGLTTNTVSKKPLRPAITKTVPASAASIFPDNSDSDSESSSSESSSSDDSDSDGPSYMKNLAKPKVPKRRSKDDEIADSDVERTSTADKSNPAKKSSAPVKVKVPPSSDDDSSGSDSESSDEKVSAKKPVLKQKASSTSASSPTSDSGSDSASSSSSEDSSSVEEESSESEGKVALAKPTAPMKKATSKSSPIKQREASSNDSTSGESESESDQESEPAAKPKNKSVVNGTKAMTATAEPTESNATSNGSSEEESSSGSENGAESSDDEDVDESMHIAERAQASQAALPTFLPPDFELRKSEQQSNGQDVARVCSEANQQGKQLWYFTLPANVPVSVVENLEFPLDSSQQCGSILRQNGEDYGVSFDSMPPTKSVQILIPSADGSTYEPARHAVNEVMQIRRITEIGVTTATPAAVGSSTKVARPQPKGLTARFRPIGVTSNVSTHHSNPHDKEDVEMGDIEPTEATPKARQKKDKKRKEASDPKESTRKSKKSKRDHTISEDEDAAAAEQLMKESVSASTKSKKRKTAPIGSPDLGSEGGHLPVKQTLVVPPAIPTSSATVPATPTPAKKTKKGKSSEVKPATPPSQVSGGAKKETPVPVPVLPGFRKPAASRKTPAKKKATQETKPRERAGSSAGLSP